MSKKIDALQLDLFKQDLDEVARFHLVTPDQLLLALQLVASGATKRMTQWMDWDVMSRALIDEDYAKKLLNENEGEERK